MRVLALSFLPIALIFLFFFVMGIIVQVWSLPSPEYVIRKGYTPAEYLLGQLVSVLLAAMVGTVAIIMFAYLGLFHTGVNLHY